MDLLGTEVSQKDLKTKRTIKIISIILVILCIISIGLGVYIYYLQSQQLKVTIDGKSISASSVAQLFLFDEQDKSKVYISIKDIASQIGYSAYNGEYNQYTEDSNSCYLENTYEIANYTKGSNKIYKMLKKDKDYEYFTIDEPAKLIDGKIYTTPDGISIGANISFSYEPEKNRITIYTLDYLANSYGNTYQNAAITGEKADFSNKKALLYERLVVTNAEGKYGVMDLKGNTIIGEKYDTIKFVESSKEFIVTTPERKMGIISYDAITVIQPEYDEIKQIDKDLDLYLVKNNNKQGVINKNGKFIVYMEYDQIGIDTSSFSGNNIKNQYLLYGYCIPVKRDKYWGMIDKNGNEVLPVIYECFGSAAKDKTTNGVLLLPKYEAIVVKGAADGEITTSTGEKKTTMFGVVDKYGKILIRNVLESVYSVTNNGVETYYMTYGGQTINIDEYFKQYGVNVVNTQQENTDPQTDTNTIEDTNTTQDQNTQVQDSNTADNANTISQNEVNTTIGQEVIM